MTDLVERLRAKADEIDTGGPFYSQSQIFWEAARRIEADAARLEKAREAIQDALGWHQVTHIHAALEQAPKELS